MAFMPRQLLEVISIHTLRMEGDHGFMRLSSFLWISIHTLRMEGDRPTSRARRRFRISIHTLRMEGDMGVSVSPDIFKEISIHTLRMEGDATLPPRRVRAPSRFQSTPSAWRVTVMDFKQGDVTVFQSTPSAWRVTCIDLRDHLGALISIHTLRMEGDSARRWRSSLGTRYFNPHPPHGG